MAVGVKFARNEIPVTSVDTAPVSHGVTCQEHRSSLSYKYAPDVIFARRPALPNKPSTTRFSSYFCIMTR